jgi:heat-inducible transcriptional repressor
MDIQLDGREQQILSAVVERHIGTGEPVASRLVSGKGHEKLSPATIRNTMADLEELGLLEQPHASAGRVPTATGYRVYVDNLMRQRKVAPTDQEFINQSLGAPLSDVSDLYAQVPKVLSKISHQIGVVITPSVIDLRLRRIEFIRLADHRIVAIVVAESGVMHNKVFDSVEDYSQDALDKAGRYLTDQFLGSTLPEARERIATLIEQERALYDKLHRDALTLGKATMEPNSDAQDQGQMFLDGAANLLSSPEFADVDKMQGILRTLDEKDQLLKLLTRCIDENSGGIRVFIGEESKVPELEPCTLITSTYGTDGSARGALGVIGPTRMEYAKAVALVDYVSRFFGQMLAQYKA